MNERTEGRRERGGAGGERKQRDIIYRLECMEWDRVFLCVFPFLLSFLFVPSPSFPSVCPETRQS